jgi:hypothetical protein
MAPVLVPLRPSSEHILIVRAPGARDQHGCHSTPFIVRVLRARRMAWLFPPIPSKLARFSLKGVAWIGPQLRTSSDINGPSQLARTTPLRVARLVSHCARPTKPTPSPVFSEAAGVVSIARIERPQFYRGGSASTETMPAASLLILLIFHPPTCEHYHPSLR